MRDWISSFTVLNEKTSKESTEDKKIDEKEDFELKRIYNHYLDKRKEIMTSTQFKVEDIFVDVKSNDSISHEQTTKQSSFSAKIM